MSEKRGIWSRIRKRIHSVLNGASSDWAHASAQRFEIAFAENLIKKTFADLWDRIEQERVSGGLWQSAADEFFMGNEQIWNGFRDHVRDRKCLEIGSGPYGYLTPCYWIRNRIVIDPLVDEYRRIQIAVNGKTLFGPQIVTHACPAELPIDDLINKVDGAIICRNALDHCDDPLAVLHAIGKYSAEGCYLLFWTDIWHLHGTNEGHRNITKSEGAIDALLRGLGFDILQRGKRIRDPLDFIEYGVVARKSKE